MSEVDVGAQGEAILRETAFVPKLNALWETTLQKLIAAKPELEELESWKSERTKHLGELEALRSEAEQHRQARAIHQFAINDLLRQKAQIEDEIGVVTRDLARARQDYETLVKALRARA
jgi:hypothetical protein